MSIKHILFDLDGTLLPMNQDAFTGFYLPLLAKSYLANGVSFNTNEFIAAVWKGYKAMVTNDGSRTNREAFWQYMNAVLPLSQEKSEELAELFYQTDFNQTISVTSPTPLANSIVKLAKEKGISVYLATNPVFPRCATLNRMIWAGLDANDFAAITTYEDFCFCKPNPKYFREILRQFQLTPKECLMVGNDVEEDLAIRTLGVKTYLVTDTMENRKNLPVETEYMGSLAELLEFIKEL